MFDFRVLGLFGPAGSGKDLVADWLVSEKQFVKLAYADPMKRFVRLTFNIGLRPLWGPSEERNALFEIDDTWWVNAFRNFHEGNREITRQVLAREYQTSGYLALIDWMQWLRSKYPTQISARIILQTLGTEWGRQQDPQLWALYAHKLIGQIREGRILYNQVGGPDPTGATRLARIPTGVVVSDHRFKNEIALTQKNGGYVLRLRRLANEKREDTVGIAGHQSEAESKTVADADCDCVLEFEEGIEKVYLCLEGAYKAELWKTKKASAPGMAPILLRTESGPS